MDSASPGLLLGPRELLAALLAADPLVVDFRAALGAAAGIDLAGKFGARTGLHGEPGKDVTVE